MTGRLRRFLRDVDRRLACGALLLGDRLRPHRHRAGKEPTALAAVRSVLVVRLDEIGDMVLTTPFLRELRRNLPHASITLVVRPELFNLVALCPYVDRVLAYDHDASTSAFRALAHARAFARDQFTEAFDLGIAPRWDHDPRFASMLVFQSGARWRLGYRDRALLTHMPASMPERHEAARNLNLIRSLGGTTADDRLELWLNEDDERFATEFLAAHGAERGGFLLAIAPGATSPRRRWPVASFATAAADILRAHGGTVVVVGGEADRALGEQLRNSLGGHVINAVGQTTLRETAAILKRCTLFVGNDSGPMHLAAAGGVPVIEISCHPGAGDPDHVNAPERFGPGTTPHKVLQPIAPLPPCTFACVSEGAHCIQSISPADAGAAATALLSSPR